MDFTHQNNILEKSKMLKQVWRGRGRPPNSRHSYKNERLLECMHALMRNVNLRVIK